MVGWCAVPGCNTQEDEDILYHCLPANDMQRCRRWLAAIQKDVNLPVERHKHFLVCEHHFRPEEYERDLMAETMGAKHKKKLKSTAIPTIFPWTDYIFKRIQPHRKNVNAAGSDMLLSAVGRLGAKPKGEPGTTTTTTTTTGAASRMSTSVVQQPAVVPVAFSPQTVKRAVGRLASGQTTAGAGNQTYKDAEVRMVSFRVGSSLRTRVLTGPWEAVADNLVRGRFKAIPRNLMAIPGLGHAMLEEVLKLVTKECVTLASMRFNSVLRQTSPLSLKTFNWTPVTDEWKNSAPTFLSFLSASSATASLNPNATKSAKSSMVAMAGALLLRARSKNMCAPMYRTSMLLRQGRTRTRCQNKLAKMGVCVSSHSSLTKRREITLSYDKDFAACHTRAAIEDQPITPPHPVTTPLSLEDGDPGCSGENVAETTVVLPGSDDEDAATLTDEEFGQFSREQDEDEDDDEEKGNTTAYKNSVQQKQGKRLSAKKFFKVQRKNKAVKTPPHGTSVDVTPENGDLCVNRDCLLQLFRLCRNCGFEVKVSLQGQQRSFSVIQMCPICSHTRTWMSQPPVAEETSGEREKDLLNGQPCKDRDQDLDDSCSLTMEITEEMCDYDEEGGPSSDKKKSRKERSDETEWEPSDEEDIVMDSDSSEELETAGSSGLTEEANIDNCQTRIENEERLVEWCTDCGAEPVLACTTQRHKKLYACGVCVSEVQQAVGFDRFYMRFEDPASFKEHVRREHNAKPHWLLCKDCGKRHFKKDNLCKQKIKKLRCRDCGKRCLSEQGLWSHRRLHQKGCVYPCKFCLKPFRTKQNKLTHEENHRHPYQCSECSERFKNIRLRNRHLQSHRGPNRYICDVCNKRFLQLKHLQKHTAVHRRQRPHTCQLCQRSFTEKRHLRAHMRSKCQQCEKCFNRIVHLKIHIQRHHGPGSQKQGEREGTGDREEELESQDPNSGTEQEREEEGSRSTIELGGFPD